MKEKALPIFSLEKESGQIANLLKEKVKEDYVLYFQEDMWFKLPVNASFFNQLFALTTQNKWKEVKLHSSDVYNTRPTELFIEGFNVAELNNEASGYLMSHQITLWDKKFLLAQLHKGEHPWRNERKATKRLKKLNPQIFNIDYFADNGNPSINNNINPVMRSAYDSISVNATLGDNILPFIEAIKQDEEAYAKQLLHNYENKLTHDGFPRPHKTDIFKKIKNWIQGK